MQIRVSLNTQLIELLFCRIDEYAIVNYDIAELIRDRRLPCRGASLLFLLLKLLAWKQEISCERQSNIQSKLSRTTPPGFLCGRPRTVGGPERAVYLTGRWCEHTPVAGYLAVAAPWSHSSGFMYGCLKSTLLLPISKRLCSALLFARWSRAE